jgi:hypothetical protein
MASGSPDDQDVPGDIAATCHAQLWLPSWTHDRVECQVRGHHMDTVSGDKTLRLGQIPVEKNHIYLNYMAFMRRPNSRQFLSIMRTAFSANRRIF